jgi:glycosyltransferase involved in cell wall biosynthesis
MKALLVGPSHATAARGNVVTVERWQVNLERHGVKVRRTTPAELDRSPPDEIPDVVHAHHAVHAGPAALRFAHRCGGRPLVVSLGGTDLHGGPDGGPDPAGQAALRAAAAVVAPFAADEDRLRRHLPEVASIHLVRRGVVVGEASPPRSGPPLRGLVVGGIRPVKGQLDALAAAAALRAEGLPLHLEFVGPAVDPSYAEQFQQRIAVSAPDRWVGERPREAMAQHYARADFLLNHSRHEGGSNAALEALAAGRPVAASDVPGNRDLLGSAPEPTALLFSMDDGEGRRDLMRWLSDLAAEDASARRERAAMARAFVRREHDAEDEILELLAVYRSVL